MKAFHWLYYAFNRWRFGVSYGCGRCHHAHVRHYDNPQGTGCVVHGCPCSAYSIERVTL
jgi:hypothetical protein